MTTSLLRRIWRRFQLTPEQRALSRGFDAHFAYQRKHGFPHMRTKFEKHLGYPLNLDNPQSFNEKLAHQRLLGRDPIWITVTDKVAVRDWLVAEDLLRAAKLVPVVGIYDDVETLLAADLPPRFIAKAAWASSRHVIVTDLPADRAKLAEQAHSWMGEYPRYGVTNLVWPAQHIPPRIIVEELLPGPAPGLPPNDYKFFVIHGRVVFLQIDTDRFGDHLQTLFDRDGTRLDVQCLGLQPDPDATLPPTFARMIDEAERIGSRFGFARIDLYGVGEDIYFGEITQAPNGGHGRYTPVEFDHRIGAMWDYTSQIRTAAAPA